LRLIFKMNIHKKRSFTLIELLVVVTIIAILMSLLAPALRKTIYKAKVTKCTANLKQIGINMSMYTDDNNTIYPLTDADKASRNSRYKSSLISEYSLLLPYFNDKAGMKKNYTCPLIEEACDAKYPASRFPYNGANGVKMVPYQLWYQYKSGQSVKVKMEKEGERWQSGSNGYNNKWFDILASDYMGCRQYGMDSHDGTWGGATNHVPLGIETTGLDYFHWMGLIIPDIRPKAFDVNYLYSDGSARNRDTLLPGLNLAGTYETRLPMDDAYESP